MRDKGPIADGQKRGLKSSGAEPDTANVRASSARPSQVPILTMQIVILRAVERLKLVQNMFPDVATPCRRMMDWRCP